LTRFSVLESEVQSNQVVSASSGLIVRIRNSDIKKRTQNFGDQFAQHFGQSGNHLSKINHCGSVQAFQRHSLVGAGAGFTTGRGFPLGLDTPMLIIRKPNPLRSESRTLMN